MKNLFFFALFFVSSIFALNAANFESFPKIVRVGAEAEIAVESKDFDLEKNAQNLIVRGIGEDGRLPSGELSKWAQYADIPFKIEDGKIKFKFSFPRQQTNSFVFFLKQEGKKDKKLGEIAVFSANKNLFNLRPFKGEIHLHSTNSDGADPIEKVGLECLKHGYDFMSLSDHGKYESSLALIEQFKSFPLTMKIYMAEEVHPNGAVHIHSFGAKKSITNWIKNENAAYKSAVEACKNALSADLPPDSRTILAQTEVVVKKIKSLGGVAIFNHPYWIPNNRFTVSNEVRNALYNSFLFDAIEVCNGLSEKGNNNILSIAQANDVQMRTSKVVNMIGNSDAHSVKNISTSYTIAFAPQNTLEDIQNAMRTGKTLAVQNAKNNVLVCGQFEYVDYAYFLLTWFYPAHDAICEAESLVLADVLADKADAKNLEIFKKQMEDYFKKCWQN